MKKVSIIVPVYNVELHLKRCLESLVNQTLQDIEIIIINDGSKDNSQDIIDKFHSRYPDKIKYYIIENSGAAQARNYGLSLVEGEYIGFVDSDDYVEPNMFEELYSKAIELGCNKNALGHHFDDVIETILMGMLYGSQIQTMMPKLHSENYSGMELIRPLYLVRESSIISWAEHCGLEFIQCACRMTECDAESHTSKRSKVKEMLRQLRETDPAVDMNIFRSVENVNLQTLISYHLGNERHHFLDSYHEGLSIRGTKKHNT